MADDNTPTRRITRSMTMKTGSAVCEEVKLSALLKATRICEAERENEKHAIEVKIEEEHIIRTKISFTPLPFAKADNSLDESKSPEKFEDIDTASNQRRILEKLEMDRVHEVEDAVVRRAAKLRAHSLTIRSALEERAKQREKERLEEEAAIQTELQELENLERNRTALVLQLQSKKNIEHEKKIEKIIEDAGKLEMKKREELKAKREILEKIVANQHKFREIYQEISDTLKAFPYREDIVSGGAITQEIAAIKNLTGMMETLSKQCKVGEVSNLDLTTSDALVQSLSAGFSAVKAKLDIIRKHKEETSSAAPPEIPKTESLPTSQDSTQSPASFVATTESESVSTAPETPEQKPSTGGRVATGLEGFISKENLMELTRLQSFLEMHLNSLKPFESDESMKKFRFQLQKSVNTPLNAISAVSASHLKDKLQRLQAVLRGQPVEVGSAKISASSHPQGVAYCTNLLAERIVDQGEQIVSSKPDSAFAIAAVAYTLWAEFPAFGDLLFAHFYTKCPFLVPYYSPRPGNISDQSFYKSLGYKYDEEGKIEAQDKYLKRMTGTAHLYFAILTSKLPRDVALQPPLSLAKTWQWLASLLNLDPRPDISATVLLTCLEVTGNVMCATYQKQFHKLLAVIAGGYFPLIQQLSPDVASGPISRLELFLTKTLRGFVFPAPAGALPPHFW